MPATKRGAALRPWDLAQFRQNGSLTGRLTPPRPFRPLSRRSGRIPALPSAQVLPEWIDRNLATNRYAANGDNLLLRVSLQRFISISLWNPGDGRLKSSILQKNS